MKDNYQDIMHLKRPKSNHEPMPLLERASQFAPFSALTGYKESLIEASRMTEEKKELSLEQINHINHQILILKEMILEKPLLRVIYFKKDPIKEGGSYETVEAPLKKLDLNLGKMSLLNQEEILLNDLYDVEIL